MAKRKTRGKGIVEDAKKFVRKGLAEEKTDAYQDLKKVGGKLIKEGGKFLREGNKALKKSKVLSSVAEKINPGLGEFIRSKGYGGLRMRGDGWWEDAWGNVDKFLKDSKVLSTVGNVVLPAAGGALAGLVTANPLGAAAGGALGTAGNQWLKAQGYGKTRGMGYSTQPLRLTGSGLTIASNGTYQQLPARMGGSGGAPYGMISSEFGKIQA